MRFERKASTMAPKYGGVPRALETDKKSVNMAPI